MTKWKYLLAYAAPASAIAGLYFKGWAAPGAMYIGFVLIPLIEGLFFNKMKRPAKPESIHESPVLFNLFLYLNLPLLYFIVFYYLYTVQYTSGLTLAEHIGFIFSVGLVIGTAGINVAHELGHRRESYHRWMSWSLLLPALYLHFYIEHNKGHHRYIATPQDPATARRGEPIYSFWVRSVTDSYRHAWQFEKERLRSINRPVYSRHNLMIWFLLVILFYLVGIFVLFSFYAMIMAMVIAIVGFLFLESVNYIEHYGLMRTVDEKGSPGPIHDGLSWDADQPLGRIFLYELTRHADHHTNATTPYQRLSFKADSPKLAHGYPASILLSLIPPWWFNTMDKRLPTQP